MANSSTYKVGEWQFLVGTFDGSYLRLWVDGRLEASTVLVSGDEINHIETLCLGAFIGETGLPAARFNGAISRAFITETVLQEAQVKALYEHGRNALAGEPQYDQENVTLVYQYDTGLWSLQDKGYSALALIETDGGQRLVGADGRNFVYELDSTDTDGATGTRTLCGIVTASGAGTFTCANAVFSTDGDGLAGTEVRIYDATGELWQTRRILSNTETECTIDDDWSPSDIVGYEFVIAGIGWRYQTPVLHFGDIVNEKIPRMLSLAQEANDVRSLRDDNGYNLCPNGLLDAFTGGTPDNFADAAAATTISQIIASLPTTNVRYVARCECDAAGEGIRTETFSVVPATAYTFRVWIKNASATDDTCLVTVYDQTNGANIDTLSVDAAIWTRQEIDFTTPALCTELRVLVQENETDNTADFQIGEMMVVRAGDDDLPVDQKVRVRVDKDLAGSFEDADTATSFVALTSAYERLPFDDARGALVQFELSNKYPGQPVEIHATDLEIELTEVKRGGS